VRSVEDHFHRHGFRTAIVSRSGQRRGVRAGSLAFDGDLLAIAPEGLKSPHFVVEVGGMSKRVASSIDEMTAQGLPPGFAAIVVRHYARGKWRWYLSADTSFFTLEALLEAL
jgi:hypothetical protein